MTEEQLDILNKIRAVALLLVTCDSSATLPARDINNIGLIIEQLADDLENN